MYQKIRAVFHSRCHTLYKVKDETGSAVTLVIYDVLGINKQGHKELLGMYISKIEGANFWCEVMTDIRNRGVKYIMICCVNGMKGFPNKIQSVFPQTSGTTLYRLLLGGKEEILKHSSNQ